MKKALKIIFIVIAVIIIVPLIVALFVPNQFTVTVSETINRPRSVVYDYLRVLDNQKQYSEWVKADSNSNIQIIGTDGTVGAIQQWAGNEDVGEGEQEIIALSPERMDMDLRFEKPMKGHAKASNLLDSISAGQTKVTMEFYSDKVSYPFHIFGYFLGKPMIEKVSIQNLKNLKEILEKQ